MVQDVMERPDHLLTKDIKIPEFHIECHLRFQPYFSEI
jgi:hypothetical protein